MRCIFTPHFTFMKRFLLIFTILFSFLSSYGQDSTSVKDSLRYSISLITCGPGDDLYALYGHSAIRVKDNISQKDVVYNYGTFDSDDPKFYQNFVLGKLNYWVGSSHYQSFVDYYKRVNRTIKETPLNLNNDDAIILVEKLENNLLPENKMYLYDFIYANCATKIRDIFESISLEFPVEYGNILKGEQITYRQIINQYMLNDHWSRTGINLLLGSPIDSVMSDYSSMFLPDFLELGVKYARFKKNDFAQETTVIYERDKGNDAYKSFNGPFWLTLVLLIVTVLSYHVRILNGLKSIMNFVILVITGLLGGLLLFMWLGTDHQACNGNWNILWALPSNLIIAFIAHKKKVWFKMYALAGISCIIVALIIHTIGMQILPLTEIFPLLGCLVYVYMYLYYQGVFKSAEMRKLAEN